MAKPLTQDEEDVRISDEIIRTETFVPLDERPVETDRAEAMRGPVASPLSTASSGQPLTLLYTPPEILRGEANRPGPEQLSPAIRTGSPARCDG